MKAVVFLNGEYSYEEGFIQNMVDEDDIIFCADGGADYAFRYKVEPDYIIGDMDSVSADILDFYKERGINIERYSPEKDYTDFELILQRIGDYEKGKGISFDGIYVFGGLGKRTDMTLNNLHLLEKYTRLVFFSGDEEIFYRDEAFSLKGREGYGFSIIPLSEKIEELSLKGFKYELENTDVERKSSRLVSNVVTSGESKVEFGQGKLLVILKKGE